MRWFDPAGWVRLAAEHGAESSALVPSMIQMLLSQPLEEADLSALTAVSSGAAPLAEEVRREFEARVPTAMIYEGYGCTEAATLISANLPGSRRVGSVGRPVSACVVSIRDDAERAAVGWETYRDGAAIDPGIAADWRQTNDLRRQAFRAMITRVPSGALRPGLTHDAAADTAWVIASPDTHDQLVRHAGYSYDQLEEWVRTTVCAALLG